MSRGSRLAALAAGILVAATVAGCSGSSPSKLTDPHQIMTESLKSTSDAKTFHIKVQLNGSVKLDALSGVGGGTSIGLSEISLDNTTVEGDFDVKTNAGHLSLTMPSLMGMKMDLIMVDGYTYTKSTIGGSGDKYQKSKTSSVVPVASALPSGSQTIKQMTDELEKQLDEAGIKPQLKGTEKVEGQDAYHVVLPMPLDKINAAIAEGQKANPSMGIPAGLTVDAASLDMWSYVKDNRLAKMELKGESAKLGKIDLVLTLTNYDKAVSIKAPPASEIADN